MPFEDADGKPVQEATFNSAKYNTKLNPQEELLFQGWKQKNAPNDSGEDYDLRGAYKADLSGKLKRDSRGHTTDQFKKPNHPTFSDQSQYHGKDGFVGGKWGDDNSFTPSATNLKMKSPQQLQEYFKAQEPQSKLNLPQQAGGFEDADGNPVIFNKAAAPRVPNKQNPYPDIAPDAGADAFSAQGARTPQDNRTLVEGLPMVGGMVAGLPGAAAGAFAKQALTPDEPSIGEAIKDTILQGVVPRGIEAMLSPRKTVAYLASKLPQGILDRFVPGVAKANLTEQLTNATVPASRSVAARESADLVSKFTKPATGSFDAPGLLTELAGPKASQYKMQFGEQGYKTLKELADSANAAGVGKPTDSLFSWREGRRLVIGGGVLHLFGIPPGVSGGIVLGADAMQRILGNPELGQMIIQATKTGSKAPESGLLMKAVMNGLRGTTVYLQNEDGQKDGATIQSDPQTGNPSLQYQRSSPR